MPHPTLERLMRALVRTMDYYLELQEEASNTEQAAPQALALPAPAEVVGGGRRRRRPKATFIGGTYDNAVTAGEHNHPDEKLSPAENSQNVMNGIFARIAGNAGGDGS